MSEQHNESTAAQHARESLFRHNDLDDPVIQVLLNMELEYTDTASEDE